jgi:D-beta-D-heptose 7-phosphate kinase / D-beta-D-heptose 1-phosphate adenosyltransferase
VKKILVIGDYIEDEYWHADISRISPEAPHPVNRILEKEIRPGGAGNVVENLKELGANVTAVYGNKPCKKIRVVSDNKQITRMDFDKQSANITEFPIDDYDVAILSDYNKGSLSDPSTIIKKLNDMGVPIFVDPKGKFVKYDGADFVVPNTKEMKDGGSFSGEVIVTADKQGVWHNFKNYPTVAKEVYDVTGAGDTFISAVAFYYDLGIETAIKLANICAGSVVGKFGTSTVKIIMTNGCFDILHAGHLDYLRKASDMGDVLIVGLNTDESVERIKRKPINSLEDRQSALECLPFIDLVIPFSDNTAEKLYKMIQPHTMVKGGDYDHVPSEAKFARNFVSIPVKYDTSTTKIVDKVRGI